MGHYTSGCIGERAQLKIVIINRHPSDGVGGSEIQCDVIASRLTHYGHEVTYLAVGAKRSSYDTEYRTLPLRSFGFRLYALLRDLRPDVIYWRYNKKHLFVSALIARSLGIAFVYALSHLSDSKIWVRSGNHPLERFSASVGAGSNAKALLRSIPLLADPIRSAVNYLAVPLFVDAAVHQLSASAGALPVRHQVLIRNSMSGIASPFQWPRPYVVWVANIKPKKNPSKYLELAAALEDLNVDFIMIGAIQDSSYEHLARAGSRTAKFRFLGPKSLAEVNGILRGALFLVHTCNPEGFPNNMIQAWLQAKPTVSLYYDPENLIERHGLGCHSKSFDRLVADVRMLVADAQLRQQMGARAATFAAETFDPETNVRRLEAFLLSLRR